MTLLNCFTVTDWLLVIIATGFIIFCILDVIILINAKRMWIGLSEAYQVSDQWKIVKREMKDHWKNKPFYMSQVIRDMDSALNNLLTVKRGKK